MCGIVGRLITEKTAELTVSKTVLQEMSDRLIHRGPDGAGLWCSAGGEIGIAHRRLAILDLTEAGAQPMPSHCGRFMMVFNGEIYNHLDLRKALDSVRGPIAWRGHSDTETLLAGISHWGLTETLKRSYGMFALAVWDVERRTLSLARDRMGEKPLFVAQLGKTWAFASELSALQEFPECPESINLDAASSQIATGVVPDKSCILKGVSKVHPGTVLTISATSGESSQLDYETFGDLVQQGKALRPSPPKVSQAAADQIENVLSEVVASQMISDVPLGSFLSGGVDSSLITSLMQVNSTRPVKTFSIGFADAGYDESEHAEAVAEHLGTDHQTFRLREDDALDIIPELASIYGEPFADSSQIPTLLLCREARKYVTVALTGDGGDEIFGGYNRHILAPKLWGRVSKMPAYARRAGKVVGGVLSSRSDKFVERASGLTGLSPSVFKKAGRFGEIIGNSSTLDQVYFGLTRHCDNPKQFLKMPVSREEAETWNEFDDLEPAERLMALDSVGYLPSDILVKVDRAAMSASLETRAPFLDARTVRAAWSLDLCHRIRDGVGKAVLRDILYRHVPRHLIERPKQGFAIPIDNWLRGPLKVWADHLISEDLIEVFGVLQPRTVREVWSEHLTGRRNHGHLLWSLLMLQQWLQQRGT
ncbi:asparagine synthase (glutamine-hydrolyzing) [Flavimaricola sp.]|nr:asparagine synthase (glutamine-hydrolyzing) [Flavimaricola sp.]MDA9020136.1 asparagine synthase (glutamine-hydrolyzing) [Flavimaricola sp.]